MKAFTLENLLIDQKERIQRHNNYTDNNSKEYTKECELHKNTK